MKTWGTNLYIYIYIYIRFLHVRLRQFAEAIAFSRGEREEHARAKESLNTLLDNQRKVVNRELPLHCKFLTYFFSFYIFCFLFSKLFFITFYIIIL